MQFTLLNSRNVARCSPVNINDLEFNLFKIVKSPVFSASCPRFRIISDIQKLQQNSLRLSFEQQLYNSLFSELASKLKKFFIHRTETNTMLQIN